MISVVGWSEAAISSLKPFKGNPRRGDVAAIAESLSGHGQYRPVVANKRTRTILAGHHVIKAAKTLGLSTVTVAWVDVDDDTARAIVLADNRLGDLADYNLDALQNLLTSLPDLDGTLFTADEVDRLDDLYGAGGGAGRGGDTDMGKIVIGPHRYQADPDVMTQWSTLVKDKAGSKAAAGRALRDLLRIPKPTPPQRTTPTAPAPQKALQPVEEVPLADLRPFPGNARQGDIGALCESLARFGQYRPIVANRATGHVLVGNHTYTAASALGWPTVAVWWVDVDDTTEAKIVLADNRASDLGTYDDEALQRLLMEAAGHDLTGTGFDGDDVDAILSGGPTKPGPSRARSVTVAVADLSTRIERGIFDRWLPTVPEPVAVEFEHRLNLAPGTLEET